MTTPTTPAPSTPATEPQLRVNVTGPEFLPHLAEQIRGYSARPGDLVYLGMAGRKLEMSANVSVFDIGRDKTSLIETALDAARALAQRRVSVILLAYGDTATIQAAADTALTALDFGYNVPIQAAYRIHDGRMYCLLCQECMPGGSAVAAQPVTDLEPVSGGDRDSVATRYSYTENPAMDAAVTTAISRYARSFAHVSGPDELNGEVLAAGQSAIKEALANQADGITLGDDQAAWLMLLLSHTEVCRHVWAHAIDGDDCWHLWSGLLGRTPDRLAAPVAAALALSSLLRGDGVTTNIAIEHAARTDPGHPLLPLLHATQRLALNPAEARSALADILAGPADAAAPTAS